jgi:hypothetical protein
MFNANKTEYHKIETLYERDMEKTSPTFGKLRFPLTLKNLTYSVIKEWNWTGLASRGSQSLSCRRVRS